MSSYQALIFDLDGTAMQNSIDASPSRRVVDTINRHRHNMHFVTATGRPLAQAVRIIEMLGLTGPCAVSGGTIIYDPVSKSVLKSTHLPADSIHAIFRLIKNQPYNLMLRESLVNLASPSLHPSLTQNMEIAFIGKIPPADAAQLILDLQDIPEISASLVPDWDGGENFALNITHKDATKEHAAAELLSRLGVAKENAIGIGDGNNDLHLFRSVGLKVAMGNASDELKAAADVIAPTVDEDGLAHIIEQYAPALVTRAHRH